MVGVGGREYLVPTSTGEDSGADGRDSACSSGIRSCMASEGRL